MSCNASTLPPSVMNYWISARVLTWTRKPVHLISPEHPPQEWAGGFDLLVGFSHQLHRLLLFPGGIHRCLGCVCVCRRQGKNKYSAGNGFREMVLMRVLLGRMTLSIDSLLVHYRHLSIWIKFQQVWLQHDLFVRIILHLYIFFYHNKCTI